MAKKIYWLSERQIGDQVWESDFLKIDGFKSIFREFKIGFGFVDFAVFHESAIDLFELKITATSHSVFQLKEYSQNLEDQITNTFFFNHPNLHDQAPKVLPSLIARFFDSDVIELCHSIGITPWRCNICDKSGSLLSVELIQELPREKRLNDPELDSILKLNFSKK